MSTMRIVTPNDAVKEVEKVRLMVEKRFMFNVIEKTLYPILVAKRNAVLVTLADNLPEYKEKEQGHANAY